MASQIICTIATIAVLVNSINAGIAPLAQIEDFDAAPQYSYAYDVQDAITGDSKAQYETRNGDVVQGSYSLIEADGTRRIVDYTADPINGFNAVVNREPAVAVAPAAPVVAKAVVPAAPVVARAVAAPVIAKTVVPASPVVAAPVLAKTVVPRVPVAAAPYVAAPVVAQAYGYTIPRAVATRLASPYYSAPLTYAVAPTTVF